MAKYILRKHEIQVFDNRPITVEGAAPMKVLKVATQNERIYIWSWEQNHSAKISRRIILMEEDAEVDLRTLQDLAGNQPELRYIGMVKVNGGKFSACWQMDYMPEDDDDG